MDFLVGRGGSTIGPLGRYPKERARSLGSLLHLTCYCGPTTDSVEDCCSKTLFSESEAP